MVSFKDRFWHDITCFGSGWFYLFVTIFVGLTGEGFLSIRLLIGVILCYLITVIIRTLHPKDRPVKQKYKNAIEKFDSSSFPSMHSIDASMLFFFFSFHYQNIFISGLFLIMAILVFTSRYVLKKHYPIDITAGAIIGALIAYGVYFFI